MANCTSIRVDHLDLNTSGAQVDPAQGAYNPTLALAYFVYANQADTFVGSALNRTHAVYFRTFDPATEAFGTPVQVVTSANDATGRHEFPRLVRLDSGVLIVSYVYYNGAGWGVYAKESTDNGLTWSAQVAVIAISATGPASIPPVMASDGTNVWVWAYYATSSPHLVRFNKRTSASTWGTESTAYTGIDNNDEWPYYEYTANNGLIISSSIGMMCAPHFLGGTGSPTSVKMSCLRTTNGSTFSEVTIKDYGTDGTQAIRSGPKVVMGTDGRIRAMWLQVSSGPTTYTPVMAYSDDQGATWNFVGAPTDIPISTIEIDQQEWGFVIGPDNRLYFSCFFSSNAEFRIYRGGDSAAGWTAVHTCTYVGNTISTGKRTSAFFAGAYLLHCFSNIGTGPTHFELGLLSEEFTTPGGGPGPEAPPRSETGADENNVYLRKVLGPKSGGWSVHMKPVSCWMSWDEGDKETGREVPILTAGNEVWPMIQDPAIVGIINRIEAPDLYGVRVYFFNGVRYDPLKVAIWSKEFTLKSLHDRNAARYIFLTYARSGDPFRVELWGDSHLIKEYLFESTFGLQETKFRAVPAFANTCEKIHLRVDEESLGSLTIDSMGFGYISKGPRGNRA